MLGKNTVRDLGYPSSLLPLTYCHAVQHPGMWFLPLILAMGMRT